MTQISNRFRTLNRDTGQQQPLAPVESMSIHKTKKHTQPQNSDSNVKIQ
jgi:hypothetical protein